MHPRVQYTDRYMLRYIYRYIYTGMSFFHADIHVHGHVQLYIQEHVHVEVQVHGKDADMLTYLCNADVRSLRPFLESDFASTAVFLTARQMFCQRFKSRYLPSN